MVIHLFNFKTLLRAFCLTGTIIKKEDTAGNILDKTVVPTWYLFQSRERERLGGGGRELRKEGGIKMDR